MAIKQDNEVIEQLIQAIEAIDAMDDHLDLYNIPMLGTQKTPSSKGLCGQCARVAREILRGASPEEANEYLCEPMKKWRSQIAWATGFICHYRTHKARTS